jgi:hypothetical protein
MTYEHPSFRFTYEVYGFSADQRFKREPRATFFHTADAEDFAMHPEWFNAECGPNRLYVAKGKRDLRSTGYRANRDERWSFDICPASKRQRVAA